MRTGARHKLSHWDALIVEAASRAGASQLLTEDMATGAVLNGVAIVNPFLDTPRELGQLRGTILIADDFDDAPKT